VTVEGTWQSFGGVANPVGESRPAWKVLRVLGNLVEAEGVDYVTSEDVLAECRARVGDVAPAEYEAGNLGKAVAADDAADDIDTPLYSIDALVRRARALQMTPAAQRASGKGES